MVLSGLGLLCPTGFALGRQQGKGDRRRPRPSGPRWWHAGLRLLAALFFYLLAGVCVASALMVIDAKNPVIPCCLNST